MAAVPHPLPSSVIKHKGYFDLSKLLNSIKDWFSEQEYDFHFTKHKYKIPSPAGIEQEIELFGERKINEYVKYTIKLTVRVFELKEVEMVKEGQKIKTNSGRLAIEIGGSMLFDYENRFGGSKTMQAVQDFYHKLVIKRTIEDQWEDDLFLKIVDLMKLMRRQFQHETIA